MTNSKLDIVRQTCALVRKWMVDHYGSGVNLAGHCIEASELIVGVLHVAGITDAHTEEGWVKYDDIRYGECPWDAHTWVEIPDGRVPYYVDVTADQFNYGMDVDHRYAGIIVYKGLPFGVTKDL